MRACATLFPPPYLAGDNSARLSERRPGCAAWPGGFIYGIHGGATYTEAELKQRPGYRSGADADKDLAEAKKMLDAAGFKGYKGNLLARIFQLPLHIDGIGDSRREFKKVGLDLSIMR